MSCKSLKYGNINLTKEISSGSEGTAYFTDNGLVAKIYHPNKINQNKHEKLKQMLQTNVLHPSICWPLDILTDHNNSFVGFVMQKADGAPLKYLFLPEREKLFPKIKRKHLVRLCVAILEIFEYLESINVIIGDINPNHFLINEKGLFVIDTDSFQIGNYPCPGGTPEFTAPEIQGINFETFMRTKEHEYFAIAVLLFQILFVGKHPYSKIGGGGVAENIRNQDFVYPLDSNDWSKIPQGNWKNIWENLPYEVKKGFYKTFKENKRLNIKEWTEVLGNYLEKIEKVTFIKQILPNKIFKRSRIGTLSNELIGVIGFIMIVISFIIAIGSGIYYNSQTSKKESTLDTNQESLVTETESSLEESQESPMTETESSLEESQESPMTETESSLEESQESPMTETESSLEINQDPPVTNPEPLLIQSLQPACGNNQHTDSQGTCICNTGYVYGVDKNTCIKVDHETELCHQTYGYNTYGRSGMCYCTVGYVWNETKTACIKNISGSVLDGEKLYDDGKYQEAIVLYDKAISLDPNNARIYNNKGWALFSLGKYQESIDMFDRAISLDSTYVRAYNNKGWALLNLKKYNESIAVFDTVIDLDPIYVNAIHGKGIALFELQRYGDAIQMFDKAISLDSSDAFVYYKKGVALFRIDRYTESIKYFDAAIIFDFNNPEVYTWKGNALEQLGRYEEAKQNYELAESKK